jgi:hypothetical protein
MHILNLIATTALATFFVGTAIAQQIGVVASLDPNMRATAPGQPERTLAIRAGVVADDSVRTEAAARGQLLFQDETTLSVAPASQIVLDRFVYDPNGGSSSFGMQLTTGALRFVGGSTSEAQEATITTPTATLGIRGSSALVSHIGGRTIAIFLMGDRMCITTGGQRSCTSRQGGVLTENGYAGRASPELVANLLTRIDGQPPQLRRRTADAGVRTTTSPEQLPISTRGSVLGTADIDGFARIDRERGLVDMPVTD